MKKILTSALLLLTVSITSFAQQVYWGEMSLKSPEYNSADSTVIFRLNAPKATSVELNGHFTQTPIAMQKGDDGIWSVTIGPLKSDLYGYTFTVDSLLMLDPSNVYVVRDTNTLFNIFITPGGNGDLYSTHDIPHGTVSQVWYNSPSLGMDRRLTVYTPAGYGKEEGRRYPVFYLLHGLGGDETAWRDQGRVPEILDNMIASGQVEPMIVVLSNGNSPQQAAPGKNSDGLFIQPTSKLPFKSGAFEASFPEIVDFIDNNYMTIAEKEGRAIAGLSMGGMHTRAISMNYPDYFDYVALFSAAIRPMFNNPSPVYDNVPEKLKTQFENPPKLYWIAIGKDDFLYDYNQENMALMQSLQLPYTYHESQGGHTWTNWRDYLVLLLPQLFKE